MPIDAQELSRRRRIVYHSISPFASEDAVNTALQLLQDEFTDTAMFSSNQFLMRVSQTSADLGGGKTQILTRMMQLSRLVADEIGPDPVQGRTAQQPPARQPVRRPQAPPRPNVATAAPAAPTAPKQLRGIDSVFNALLGSLFDQVCRQGETHAIRFGRSLDSHSSELSPATRGQLGQWIKDRGEPTVDGASESDMHTVLHAAYVVMCEEFGPVVADRMLTFAVNQAERLPDAAVHSPRSLL